MSTSTLSSVPQAPAPQRSLGLWRATALVTGNIVGAGLLILPASLGMYGVTGLLGWLMTTVGAIFLALVFARLAKRHPKTGGPYVYSREAFGDFVGFQMAWSYWIGNWASTAGLGTAFVSYLSIFFPDLRTNLGVSFFIGTGVIWLLTFVNISGVRKAGTVQLVTTILKILPLAAIGIFGIFHINPENFTELNPSNETFIKALGTSAALTLYSFLGLESATIPAGDVQNPKKTIPRATILGTVIAAVIYIWTMIVIMGVLSPFDLSESHAPFSEAAGIIFGNWAVPLISFSALVAIFGTLNGWILIQAQVPKAAAEDHLFPKIFSKTNSKGTPYVSLLISAALMTAMLYMNHQSNLIEQFTTIAIVSTFAVLLPYLYSSVAELYFLVTQPHQLDRGRYIRSIIVALIAFIFTLIITAGAGESAVFMGMIFVFSGFPFYVLMKSKAKKTETLK